MGCDFIRLVFLSVVVYTNYMGMTEVELTISNPRNGKQSVTDIFLVDGGAAYTVVPASIVEKLKLEPQFTRGFLQFIKSIKRLC